MLINSWLLSVLMEELEWTRKLSSRLRLRWEIAVNLQRNAGNRSDYNGQWLRRWYSFVRLVTHLSLDALIVYAMTRRWLFASENNKTDREINEFDRTPRIAFLNSILSWFFIHFSYQLNIFIIFNNFRFLLNIIMIFIFIHFRY